MPGAKVYIAIDVGKEYLDAVQGKEGGRFSHDGRAHKQLVAWLGHKKGQSVQVICEASGGYERGLVQSVHERGIALSLVQASRVGQFARARGLLAKPIGSMRACSASSEKRSHRRRLAL